MGIAVFAKRGTNSPVNGRFRIDEMMAQDAGGVIFQAFDEETQQPVALRRFFPFGAGGGGLEGEERTAYEVAVQRLMQVSNPSLRAVVAGGVDEVDGMPFLAVEWVVGETLADRLARGPLSNDEGMRLAEAALGACEDLSKMLGEEEVWIEVSPDSVVMGNREQNREFILWISPLRWLGSERHGLAPLADLISQAMGWAVLPAGSGLATWVGVLRERGNALPLVKARDELARASAPARVPQAPITPPTAPPIPAALSPNRPVSGAPRSATATQRPAGATHRGAAASPAAPPQAVRVPPQKHNSTAKIISIVVIIATILIVVFGYRPLMEWQKARQEAADLADRRARRRAAHSGNVRKPEINQEADVHAQGHNLRDGDGDAVQLTATIADVVQADGGKTVYIEFGPGRDKDDLCAKHEENPPRYNSWRLLKGKRVVIPGTVVIEPGGRVAIEIDPGDDIRPAD